MMIFGVFLIIFLNLNLLVDRLGEKVQITVYLKEGGDEKAVVETIRKEKGVAEIIYISKEEALLELKRMLGEESGLLDDLMGNPLPPSLEIRFKKGFRSPESIAPLVSLLRGMPSVDEVQYGEEWVRNLTTILKGLKLTGLILGSFLAFGVIYIISNTIKIAIYARQDEIEIMRLIGATRGFINGPFLVEGTLQGICGGALGVILLYGFYRLLMYEIEFWLPLSGFHLSFLSQLLSIQIILSGALLGFLGGLSSCKM